MSALFTRYTLYSNMDSEEVELQREIKALKEAKTIVDEKHSLGFTTVVQTREQMFKKQYAEYQHVLEYPPQEIQDQIERLEKDLSMLREDDLFPDIGDGK